MANRNSGVTYTITTAGASTLSNVSRYLYYIQKKRNIKIKR